ncbi:DUF551 domain-containing protein [Enterobacter kobei]|uniref:DUF551 domain-containing protein n=1 Tax=Enterobacter kobei TaxID=208224 RepID=UPI003076273D
MSTITRELAKLFRKITNSEIDAEGNAHVVLSPADSLLINNARIALASLEAEPVAYMNRFTGRVFTLEEQPGADTDAQVYMPVYTTPPAPVSVPAEVGWEDVPEDITEDDMEVALAWAHGFNQCRSAMLKHSEPFIVTSDHRMMEMPQVEAINAVTAMLQGAAGNSPVVSDGWVACSERMPERDVDVQVYCADKKEQMVGYMERNEHEGYFRFASLPNGGGVYCKPTHWMPLPAAPQQEVESQIRKGKTVAMEEWELGARLTKHRFKP